MSTKLHFPTPNLIAKVVSEWRPRGAGPPGSPPLGPGPLSLWLEGALYTGCALLIAQALRIPHAGFFAIFLAAAGPTGRLDAILDENRRAIQERKGDPLRANAQAAAGLLSLFLGAFSVFAGAALSMGEARMGAAFGFALDLAQLGHDTILTRHFASVLPLLAHNALVLLVFFALSFVYRSYGALLALSWNACLWGLLLAFLVRRGMAGSAHPVLFVLASAAAVLPHLLLEAAGYVTGALAGIFLSKGLMKYAPGQPVFHAVLRAVLILCALSLGCLLVGAVVESTIPRLVLSLLLGG